MLLFAFKDRIVPVPIVDVVDILARAGADTQAAEGSQAYALAQAQHAFEGLLLVAQGAVAALDSSPDQVRFAMGHLSTLVVKLREAQDRTHAQGRSG